MERRSIVVDSSGWKRVGESMGRAVESANRISVACDRGASSVELPATGVTGWPDAIACRNSRSGSCAAAAMVAVSSSRGRSPEGVRLNRVKDAKLKMAILVGTTEDGA